MGKRVIYVLFIMILFITLNTCQTVDTLAQAAADGDVIDRGTANMISLSARAFNYAAESVDEEQEYYIGRAVAANILSTYKLWNGNPELTEYLNHICAAIVLNSPQPSLYNGYHVAILDSSEINAFATSGGHILVTRGLINIARTEDSLAAVIAHEIAHIQLKHGVKAIKSDRVTEALLLTATAGIGNFFGIDVDELNDVFNETVGEIIQTMVNSGYSKEQEYEADVAAMYLLAYAGYHPDSILDMLKGLNEVRVSSSGFGKTHPAPRQRVYFVQKALGRFDIADTRLERQDRFNEMFALGMATQTTTR